MSDANTLGGDGRRRLSIFVGTICGAGSMITMALVIIIYGAPYDPIWWAVMAAILVVCCLLGRIIAPAVEWVLEGYLEGR